MICQDYDNSTKVGPRDDNTRARVGPHDESTRTNVETRDDNTNVETRDDNTNVGSRYDNTLTRVGPRDEIPALKRDPGMTVPARDSATGIL